MGRPKRGHAVFEAVNRQKESIKRLLSEADVDRALGYVDDLVHYQETRSEPENLARSLCDLAKHAKDIGAHDIQLNLAKRAVDVLPSGSWSLAQLGDAYLCFGRYQEALEAYDATVTYGDACMGRSGRAQVLKAMGSLDEALKEYDTAIAEFPGAVVPRSGRAEVLKTMGRVNEALREYDRSIEKLPTDRVARSGKASALVILSRYQEALELLPVGMRRTLDDWIDFHIRGMISMKQGNLTEAVEIFETGVRDNPWSLSVGYFRNALAVAKLREKQHQEALEAIGDEQSTVSDILRIHAFGELRQIEEVQEALSRVRDNRLPAVVSLRDELASRYVIGEASYQHQPDNWVFEKECELLLAA